AEATALNIVSDNLANLNTTGFKGNSAAFHSMVTEALSSSTPNGEGVSQTTSQRNFSQGNVQVTSQGFDVALEGNGFFVVQNSAGNQLYTRAGNFNVGPNNTLVDANGDEVLGWTAANGTVNASGAVTAIPIPTGSTVA